jgi:hypothetical protein
MARKFTNKIGVEVEFFIVNSKKEIIIPPDKFDRDDFPLFGEIRSEPGATVAETIANFVKARIKAEEMISENHSMVFDSFARIKLDIYRKAMRLVTKPKNEMLGKTRNVYGTNIEDFSDQIIEKGKIQGIHASTGLHIHFSSFVSDEHKVEEMEYDAVNLPLSMGDIKTTLNLYRSKGFKTTKEMKVTASQMNVPTVEWIVKKMDDKFFKKYVSSEDKQTKYRQPGYYELKEYGFEYRSLPASDETMNALRAVKGNQRF